MRAYLGFVLAAALKNVICAKAPIDGFNVQAGLWKADIDPANSFLLAGTIQDVKERLLRFNSSWILSEPEKQTEERTEEGETTRLTVAQLPGLTCNTLPAARTSAVGQAVQDLEKSREVQMAFPTMRGEDCVTVSCVNDARVWWCYSSPVTFHLPDSWRFFVQKTRDIMEGCVTADASLVSGRYSPPGADVTVIVRGEKCDGVPYRNSWRIPSMPKC
ncbi:hypothetical protein CP532_2375 [Ophiocordyceps camponoti-leonardi (nom. inval.)]|nr:hypothetical protein CP532_2375 [Ophiocordyceps camponoti-leonardi (nom. inval.)]